MKDNAKRRVGAWVVVVLLAGAVAWPMALTAQTGGLRVQVHPDGRYSLGMPGGSGFALTTGVAAQVDGRWLRTRDYPKHAIRQAEAQGELGAATEWTVTASGLAGAPNLVYRLRAYRDAPFADVQDTVENTTGHAIHVGAIRAIDASGEDVVNLGGPPERDRVDSDSFSEDRPAMQIHDLADAPYKQPTLMHRGVGTQLIYNRESQESLFVGALTSDKFMTILRLHLAPGDAPQIASYEVESTGTTELEKENSLQDSPAEDQIPLSLAVPSGEHLDSERVLLSVSKDYHDQLETYGSLIRQIHHPRSAPPLMGWWSWTAFYFGLNEGAALTNAQWESQHLLSLGYNVFHIDEGYQYARGEYTTPNATLFPRGLTPLEYNVRGLGLMPGIWTAPFEVSQRAWVYEHHPDWLIHNAKGEPIPAGNVVEGKDTLYMLDVTNPGAADYLRQTYTKLVHEWGIHYIKLDFMDDSAIEGYFHQPNTTAMEAQRIGLGIIRKAVGDDVYLDKDGSVMLNPVGYVEYGRISQDTGHTFEATREAEPGIAARYYMNRNYFVADPDAFAVSTQTIADQSWHESHKPATLDESRAAIALAAATAGMFEIGDNLPTLDHEPDRLALIENKDLIDMVQMGRSATPIDLMDYREQDQQPTIFFLKESPRQSILTVFNWTKQPVERTIALEQLGLAPGTQYALSDVLEKKDLPAPADGQVQLAIPAESVRMVKFIDSSATVADPEIREDVPNGGAAGATIDLSAEQTGGDPVVAWAWTFGDGVTAAGRKTTHAWTEPGDYPVTLTAEGLNGEKTQKQVEVHINGHMSTRFDPAEIRRLP
ncbi:MAG TPA: alpha-galactosidase [Acidobacteriaceae bacterium]|nr:alpha-galactosidase [Acidobacteriaceae bacterium]